MDEPWNNKEVELEFVGYPIGRSHTICLYPSQDAPFIIVGMVTSPRFPETIHPVPAGSLEVKFRENRMLVPVYPHPIIEKGATLTVNFNFAREFFTDQMSEAEKLDFLCYLWSQPWKKTWTLL